MDVILVPLLAVTLKIIELYQFFLFIYVVLGWLEAFNIINRYSRVVYSIQNILYSLYEPALSRIRRFMPAIGNMDLSPVVLIFMLYFVQGIILRVAHKFPM